MTETKAELRRQLTEARAEIAGLKSGCHRAGWEYGTFLGGDPRLFRPDPAASTIEERYRWLEACAAWDRGEQPQPFKQLEMQAEATSEVCEGNVAFGMGSQYVCIPDDATIGRLALAERMAAFLAGQEFDGMHFSGEQASDACSTCWKQRGEGHAATCELGSLLAEWRSQNGED